MNSTYPTQRAPGREHIPRLPRGFISIRVIQFVVAVPILGLSAYTLALLAWSGNALSLFTALATLIFGIYCFVAECVPLGYNYWAMLALDIFLIAFWIVSMGLIADAAVWLASYGYYNSYAGVAIDWGSEGTVLIFASCHAAIAGLAGLEFVLGLIALIIESVMIHRHRAAGLHNMPPKNGMGVQPSYSSAPPPPQQQQQPVPRQQQQPPVPMQQQQPIPMQQQQPQQYQSHMPPNTQPGQHTSSYAPPQGGPHTYGLSQQQGGGIAAPTPYYPQPSPSPLSAQQTGNSYSKPEYHSPVSHQGMYQPPQQAHEAQGTQVGGYHP